MRPIHRNELKEIAFLHTKKGREARRSFLIEGEKGLQEVLNSDWVIERVMLEMGFELSGLNLADRQVLEATHEQMCRLSTVASSPGVLAVVSQKKASLEEILAYQELAAFEEINDPGNLGTMLRTADWFGLKGIILSPSCVDLYNDKVVRSSMGSLYHLKVFQSKNWKEDLQKLKDSSYTLIATEVKNGSGNLSLKEKVCFLMGSESHGLSEATLRMADTYFSISGDGEAESLNVAVSFGIILAEYRRKNG